MKSCYWRKNGAEWVVIGPVEQIATGKVRVWRRDGRVKVVEIAKMSEPFEERGTRVALGYPAEVSQ